GIHTTLAGLGFSGVYMEQRPVDDLDRYQSVWISVGIYSSNYVIGQDSQEALAIVDYLNSGGCAYLEGGDCWNYDTTIGGHNFNSMFGLTAPQDGTNDCGPVNGKAGAFTEGMYFAYSGENNWIDHLSPANGNATLVLENGSPIYGLAVAYDPGAYKTVGASFEFAGLRNGVVPSTKAHLALTIMDFFLPIPSGVDDDVVADETVRLAARPNPFNPNTTLQFVNPVDGRVHLDIYDVSGRLVRVLADEVMPAGERAFAWNGLDESGRSVASGVYFARLRGEDFSSSSKLVLLK
ncbi:T9SS type A sorting domain-containing protein, partial [bacterium]|nr:T9SS type A sorting domain-containing protein [bacterium]